MQLRRPAKLPNPEVFNVNDIDIEDEIGALVRQEGRSPYAPPKPPATDEELGTVTAEMIMAQHERTAKNFEDRKEPLKRLATDLQTALADILAAEKDLDDMAERYRALGESKREIIEKGAGKLAKINELLAAARAELDA